MEQHTSDLDDDKKDKKSKERKRRRREKKKRKSSEKNQSDQEEELKKLRVSRGSSLSLKQTLELDKVEVEPLRTHGRDVTAEHPQPELSLQRLVDRDYREEGGTAVVATTGDDDDREVEKNRQRPNRRNQNVGNPSQEKLQAFLSSLTKAERDSFFSEFHVAPERRAKIWMQQADVGEDVVNRCSWAVPNETCIQILDYFGPIVEIGCGANAYWCRQMKQAGVDVIGYDLAPSKGGRIHQTTASEKKTKKQQSASSSSSVNSSDNSDPATTDFVVRQGGPEALSQHEDRTLFLCYPDENNEEVEKDGEGGEPMPLAQACLHFYKGKHVIHVGEIYGDTLSLDQGPWGRSTSPQSQQQLAAEFHCILKVSVPGWLHVRDSLTVWKRSEVCTMVFATEKDQDNESDEEEDDDDEEEVNYRYIPQEERLPQDFAVPYLRHLIRATEASFLSSPIESPSTVLRRTSTSKPKATKNSQASLAARPTSPVASGNESSNNDSEIDFDSEKDGTHDQPQTESYHCPW